MKMKRENKGFSLVELIITIAIFSIVGVVIGGFLLASNRAYSVSANELDIQEEAQLVANQLQEMILDTAIGISYQYVVSDASGSELIDYMNNDLSLPAGDLSKKQLWIYGDGYYYQIYWDKAASALYLVEYVKTVAGYAPADGMPTSGVILGEYVTDFSVDLSAVASSRMVSFDIVFQKPNSDRDYLVSRSISLRNNVLTNKSKEEVYNSAGLEFEPVPDNLSITPAYDEVWPGETVSYNVTLTCSRGGVPSQDVNWALSSGDGRSLSDETKVTAGGILRVSGMEESSLINIHATASGYNYTTNAEQTLSKDLVVAVKQIRGLTITRNDFETTPVSPGGTYVVEVAMSGDHISTLELEGDNGVNANVTVGSSYATVTDVQPQGYLKALVTVVVSADAPQGAKIALSISPKKAGFTDVVANTGIYTVGGKEQLLSISSGSGDEWLRLGSATTNVAFRNSDSQDAYCNANGTLKTGYYLRYTYEVYDSKNNLVKTAYRTTGAGTGSDYTEYFSASGTGSTFSSVVNMTDKVFLTSGTVSVQASLMYKTSGEAVEVGTSDVCNYTIPQATIGFKRAMADNASGNLKSYITSQDKDTSVYLVFTSGFASANYSIYANYMGCTPASLGSVSAIDYSTRKVVILGNDNAEYQTSSGNAITFNYGNLPNNVTVALVSANVSGTGYYVPMSTSEWTHTGTDGGHDLYIYYIDDTHAMSIDYLDGSFNKASYYVMENLEWVEKGTYTMNRTNKTWDLTAP